MPDEGSDGTPARPFWAHASESDFAKGCLLYSENCKVVVSGFLKLDLANKQRILNR